MTGSQIQAKVLSVLTRVKAATAPVYLRTVSKTGAGVPINKGTNTNVDVAVTPTPAVRTVSQEDVQGSDGLMLMGDKVFLFGGDVAASSLAQCSIVYESTVYRIVNVSPSVVDSTVACYTVLARKMG